MLEEDSSRELHALLTVRRKEMSAKDSCRLDYGGKRVSQTLICRYSKVGQNDALLQKLGPRN
jgi:hypothetical protein